MMRFVFSVGVIAAASVTASTEQVQAQSTAQKVEHSVSTGAKTLKHNVIKTSKRIGHKTKKAAHKTSLATSNLIHGHRILCGDGTWASRDNPDCHGHDGVASRQPTDKDK
jgi:hypothetical protein